MVSQAALAAVVAVEVKTHEDAGTALLMSALTKKTSDLAGALVDLVVLQYGKLNLPVLVGDLLGLSVGLFLALLGMLTCFRWRVSALWLVQLNHGFVGCRKKITRQW